jgi:hypothetical protein
MNFENAQNKQIWIEEMKNKEKYCIPGQSEESKLATAAC